MFPPALVDEAVRYNPSDEEKSCSVRLATSVWNIEHRENLASIDVDKYKEFIVLYSRLCSETSKLYPKQTENEIDGKDLAEIENGETPEAKAEDGEKVESETKVMYQPSRDGAKVAMAIPSGSLLSEWGQAQLLENLVKTLPDDALSDIPPIMDLDESACVINHGSSGIYRISDAVSVDSSLVVRKSVLKGQTMSESFAAPPGEVNMNADLDFLAAVQASQQSASGSDPFSGGDSSGLLDFTSSFVSAAPTAPTAGVALSPPPKQLHSSSRAASPAHSKLSPAAAAFMRSLPDLWYMMAPPGIVEARE